MSLLDFLKNNFFTLWSNIKSPLGIVNEFPALLSKNFNWKYFGFIIGLVAIVATIFSSISLISYLEAETTIISEQIPDFVISQDGILHYADEESLNSIQTKDKVITNSKQQKDYVIVSDASHTPLLLINPNGSSLAEEDSNLIENGQKKGVFISLYADRAIINNNGIVQELRYTETGLNTGIRFSGSDVVRTLSIYVKVFIVPFLLLFFIVSFLFSFGYYVLFTALIGSGLALFLRLKLAYKTMSLLALHAAVLPFLANILLSIIFAKSDLNGYNFFNNWVILGASLFLLVAMLSSLRHNIEESFVSQMENSKEMLEKNGMNLETLKRLPINLVQKKSKFFTLNQVREVRKMLKVAALLAAEQIKNNKKNENDSQNGKFEHIKVSKLNIKEIKERIEKEEEKQASAQDGIANSESTDNISDSISEISVQRDNSTSNTTDSTNEAKPDIEIQDSPELEKLSKLVFDDDKDVFGTQGEIDTVTNRTIIQIGDSSNEDMDSNGADANNGFINPKFITKDGVSWDDMPISQVFKDISGKNNIEHPDSDAYFIL